MPQCVEDCAAWHCVNNNPDDFRRYSFSFHPDDVEDDNDELKFKIPLCDSHEEPWNIAWINYLEKKAKSIPRIKKQTNSFIKQGVDCLEFTYQVPIEYFEIRNND